MTASKDLSSSFACFWDPYSNNHNPMLYNLIYVSNGKWQTDYRSTYIHFIFLLRRMDAVLTVYVRRATHDATGSFSFPPSLLH
jgi:hypothetical protein